MSASGAGLALITGASSGIGDELARLFARHGHPLVLSGRRTDRLQALASQLQREYGVSVTVLTKDLAVPGAADELHAELKQLGLSVDCLVNNAGFGLYGFFAESNLSDQLQIIQVNLTALTHLSRLVLPDMIARRRGRILNVASTAAFQPGPLMSIYYATKAFVLSFSEALADELRGTGVTVTALCPGPTSTEFHARSGIGETPLGRTVRMSAERVAREGYRGMLAGQPLVIPGLRNRLLATLVRWLPRRMVTRFVRRIQEKRRPS